MKMAGRIFAFIMSIVTFLSGMCETRDTKTELDVPALLSYGEFSGKQGDSCIIESDEPVTVNSMAVRENGVFIKGFKLEAMTEDGYQTVTEGDTASAYRFCAFDEVSATSFRFTVTSCAEDGFSISKIELLKMDVKNDSFRVVSYFVCDGIDDSYVPDEGRFTVTTDLIVFGTASFDENGEITLRNMENTAAMMEKVRQINPEIRVHINFLGPSPEGTGNWDEDMEKKADLHIKAMRFHRFKFIKNLVGVLDTYGFDGLYFDWEYPITDSAQREFSSFLVSLNSALGDRELGLAMSGWCCKLSKLAISVIDSVEVMSYDLFDTFGYHAAFPSSYESVQQFLDAGYKKEQLHLGLAFYARPTDKGGYWINYSSYAETLGKYGNLCAINYNGLEFDAYFNGAQMVRDKTAYALNAKLGGVMIWNLSCDTEYSNPLSLYRTISDTVN